MYNKRFVNGGKSEMKALPKFDSLPFLKVEEENKNDRNRKGNVRNISRIFDTNIRKFKFKFVFLKCFANSTREFISHLHENREKSWHPSITWDKDMRCTGSCIVISFYPT